MSASTRPITPHRDGLRFSDRRAARRYHDLRLKEALGTIVRLKVRPRYPLKLGVKTLGYFTADFAYEKPGQAGKIVEVVKNSRPDAFARWKQRHFSLQYGDEVTEVGS